MCASAPVLVLLASACSDAGTSISPAVEPSGHLLLSEMRCTASVATRRLACTSQEMASTPGGARMERITVGEQHRFARLTSGTPSVSGDTMSFTVSVQNLLQQPLGTVDGAAPHGDGVQVFFASLSGVDGSQEVSVANLDGVGSFTGENQAFFRYAGQELGADGILTSGETSANKTWRIDFGDNTSFSFTAYVTAEVPSVAGSYLRFLHVSVGNGHTCGITSTGAYCWGAGNNGQLGNSHLSSAVPVAVDQSESGTFTQISVGTGYTCGITAKGAYCWGSGNAGRLGTGSTVNVDVPTAVVQTTSGTFTLVSTGGMHACGIASTGTYCWGEGASGRLGNGSITGSSVPVAVDQSASGSFTQISAGGTHTCGITNSGAAYCWGEGATGRLGTGSTANSSVPAAVVQSTSGPFTQVSAGGAHTCGITSTGAFCWGAGGNGRLGNNATPNSTLPVAVVQTLSGPFSQVSAGNAHTCGISSSGAYCWGSNANGQLGNGGLVASNVPMAVDQSESSMFTQVSASFTHTCGVTGTGAYCWGNGLLGRLGSGRDQQEVAPVPVAGSW